VEFVQIAAAGQADGYRRFAGAALAEDRPAAALAARRMNFVLDLVPARMP